MQQIILQIILRPPGGSVIFMEVLSSESLEKYSTRYIAQLVAMKRVVPVYVVNKVQYSSPEWSSR